MDTKKTYTLEDNVKSLLFAVKYLTKEIQALTVALVEMKKNVASNELPF